ncbi:MAG: 4Fe-4S dicluster domain-containing protein [Kiritimatiellia bacterium]
MEPVVISMADFDAWVGALIGGHKVIGVRAQGDKFKFGELESPADLRLDYDVTVLPPKYFLQPPCEQLLEFSGPADFKSLAGTGGAFILLGVHPYDMAAISQMDKVFSSGNYDVHYMARRQKALIIGCDVARASPNVFAACMNTAVWTRGYDILLTHLDGKYLAEAFTARGASLLEAAPGIKKATPAELEAREKIREKNRKNLRRHKLRMTPDYLPELLEKSYDHPVWEEQSKKCFSCGSCNLVCPTCYCFDVRDELRWDLRGGTRSRVWDGCMLREFAMVAGGHNFRKKLAERFRHRYYRKGKYVPGKIGEIACIGCGRCIGACVAKIANPVYVYNRLLEDK